jgi:hypothetical protein
MGLVPLLASINNVSVSATWASGPGAVYSMLYTVGEGDRGVVGRPPMIKLQVQDFARPAGVSDVVDETWFFGNFTQFTIDADRPVVTYSGVTNSSVVVKGELGQSVWRSCRGVPGRGTGPSQWIPFSSPPALTPSQR